MHLKNKKTIVFILLIALAIPFLANTSLRLYENSRSLYSQIRLFSMILERIRQDYVEEKSSSDLLKNAIDGMVSNLDPHTTYLTADDFKQWNQNFEGYSGIGITFDIIRDKITIMSVIADGPSDHVGLMQGDRIIAINNESAIGIKRDEVPLKLMGPKGTTVQVSIERKGWKKIKTFEITRNEVHVQSIPYSFILKPGIGYIRIIRFSATTAKEMSDALQQLKKQRMEKLIIDLRGNGGGYLEAAVQVSDQFLTGGKRIVYTKGRIESSFREFFSTDHNTIETIPIVVLIDRGSASASEILAGALQDWDRAIIVGETSFGKGLVQSQYNFTDGSALLMTTAKYYTPSGRLIQRPYNNGKSFDEYYTEVYNDSLRKANHKNEERPNFKTLLLQRDVFGGGGITPDIRFKTRRDTIPKIVRDLYFSEDRLFFTFVEDYLKEDKLSEMEFNQFLKTYTPNNGTLKSFSHYIEDSGFKFSKENFIEHQKEIRDALKQTIATKIWGDEARYKVQLLQDKPLLESLGYFNQSENLIQRASK